MDWAIKDVERPVDEVIVRVNGEFWTGQVRLLASSITSCTSSRKVARDGSELTSICHQDRDTELLELIDGHAPDSLANARPTYLRRNDEQGAVELLERGTKAVSPSRGRKPTAR